MRKKKKKNTAKFVLDYSAVNIFPYSDHCIQNQGQKFGQLDADMKEIILSYLSNTVHAKVGIFVH